MSHFSVAVFSRTPGDVEALLAPFNEQVAPGDPYAVFVRDESGQLDETGQAKGYWRNPNARWDWWVIGGRWRGLLLTAPGQKRLYRAVGTLAQGFRLSAPSLRRGAGRGLRFFAERGADPAGGAHVGGLRGRG